VRRAISDRRILIVAVLAVALVITTAGYAIGRGLGGPSVPSDAVAVVQDAPDGTISTADFQAALTQTAAGQGLPKPPSPSDPQYPQLRDAAMSDVLLTRWVRGEAEERGITVSDTEVANFIKQQFGNAAQFRKQAKQANFTVPQARERIREVFLPSQQIQQEVLPKNPTVSDAQVSDFYQANKSQFQQPETRDVRQIVNKDKAKVEQAKSLLEKDNSSKSWKKVAAKYSTDTATKSNGGLRQGVTKGQNEPILDQQISSASQGPLIGPFKGQAGYYLIEVDKITPAQTTPLSSVSSQIKQQLSSGAQQEAAQAFQQDFVDKWVSRSVCAPGYVMDRCSNFTVHDACSGDDSGESGDVGKTGCPTFVPSTAPVAPGKATVFPGQAPQGLPQGPLQPAPSTAAQPGVIGPPGAPQLPPGAAPQTAPPQTAPPQSAPPSTGP
jgi:foldase protein PrsA